MTDDPVAIFRLVHAQAAKAAEMAQQAIDGGCDFPEMRGAYAKFIGAMASLEKVLEPVRPPEEYLIAKDDDA